MTYVAHLVEEAGHTVRTASTAADANYLFGTDSFDLLLVDVVLPDRTGVEFVNDLPPSFPRHRIVLITAHADLSSVNDLLNWSQLTILRKPIDPVELIDCVAARLALRDR